MTSAGSPAAEATGEREYCRFGKRNLDGMSWLAPLVNNRLGDRLNLELRHEQLFFIKGNQVLEDVGYSEKGQRFTETQFGKPIHSLEDLKRNGYWLVGPEYDPAVMREALAEQKDGYYYSLFANQCQDWADRSADQRTVSKPNEASSQGTLRVRPLRITPSLSHRRSPPRFGWDFWPYSLEEHPSSGRSSPGIYLRSWLESCS